MPRPFKCRRIAMRPRTTTYKPVGVPGRILEAIVLGLDEMEAVRLADLEGFYQETGAKLMGISRPTFGRLLEQARHKIAAALFESKMLVFEGGPIIMARTRRFHCDDCREFFEEPFGSGRPLECPHCHGRRFHRVPDHDADDRGRHGADAGCQGRGRGRHRGHGKNPRRGGENTIGRRRSRHESGNDQVQESRQGAVPSARAGETAKEDS